MVNSSTNSCIVPRVDEYLVSAVSSFSTSIAIGPQIYSYLVTPWPRRRTAGFGSRSFSAAGTVRLHGIVCRRNWRRRHWQLDRSRLWRRSVLTSAQPAAQSIDYVKHRPPSWKKENHHISAVVSDIFTKFGVLLDIDIPHRPLVSFLDYNKIQDGGRRHFEKAENRKISTAIWDVFTIFLVKPQIFSDIKLQKSKSISTNIMH